MYVCACGTYMIDSPEGRDQERSTRIIFSILSRGITSASNMER